MSIHTSLKGVDTLRGERSVLTRFERIQKLTKLGKLDADDSAFGLPKVRTKFKVVKVKKKVEGEAPASPGAAAADQAAG
jgi:small basic protein (TIGR04137 family)